MSGLLLPVPRFSIFIDESGQGKLSSKGPHGMGCVLVPHHPGVLDSIRKLVSDCRDANHGQVPKGFQLSLEDIRRIHRAKGVRGIFFHAEDLTIEGNRSGDELSADARKTFHYVIQELRQRLTPEMAVNFRIEFARAQIDRMSDQEMVHASRIWHVLIDLTRFHPLERFLRGGEIVIDKGRLPPYSSDFLMVLVNNAFFMSYPEYRPSNEEMLGIVNSRINVRQANSLDEPGLILADWHIHNRYIARNQPFWAERDDVRRARLFLKALRVTEREPIRKVGE